jgi:hypothetical protein
MKVHRTLETGFLSILNTQAEAYSVGETETACLFFFVFSVSVVPHETELIQKQSSPARSRPEYSPIRTHSRKFISLLSPLGASITCSVMSEPLSPPDLEASGEKIASRVETDAISVENPNSNKDAQFPPLGQVLIIILAIYLAAFLVALDQTIIGVAIPKISDEFKSIPDIAWYGSAYFLTSTALQPSYGRIYKVLNVSLLMASQKTFLLSSPCNLLTVKRN